MSYNGSGTFNINTAGQPVVTGTVISSSVFNALTADLATGLSTAITKDGQTTITNNIPFNGYKITNLGAGTASTDAVRLGQLQAGSATVITVTGTDTYTGTMSPALAAYAAGNMFTFVVPNTNTTACTINIDGLGAKSITRDGSTALVAGDLVANSEVTVIYDGTRFQVLNSNSKTNWTVSNALTLSAGTANGVAYLNGSKALTTGSALVFDGTNLGIGTSSPGSKLEVSGQIAAKYANPDVQGILLQATTGTNAAAMKFTNTGGNGYVGLDNSSGNRIGGGAYSLNIWHESAYPIAFGTNNTLRMTLDSSGNLGLGVTPTQAYSTSRAMQLGSGALIEGRSGDYTTFSLACNAYLSAAGNWTYSSNARASLYTLSNGLYAWYQAAAGTGTISFTQAMTLDSGGNLLVGATSQAFAEKFQMYGNYAVFNNASYTGFIGQGSALGTGTASDFAVRSSNALAFLTGGATERARITSGGLLCVGATSFAAAVRAGFRGDSTTVATVEIQNESATGTMLTFRTNGESQVGSVSFTSGGVTYNTTSDYRLKTLIAPVTGSGARLDALNPIEYEWKANGKRARGFFAHEFQQIYADSVTGEKDAVDADGKPVMQAMQASTSEVIADLVAEIQSLRARVAQLESK